MRLPRRPQAPGYQKNAPGSGPAGPGNFGYFPSLESSPPAGGISPTHNRGFAAAAASFFLSDQKETKESPGVGIFRKDLRLTPWSFRNPTPGPPFYRGARGVRGQSRPARKPLEGCLCLLTAALLNGPDRLLLQDNLRLSGATYTVGAGRRAATRTISAPAKCKTVRAAGFAVGSPYEKGPFRAPLPFSISSPPAIGGRSPPPQG